MPPRKSYRPVLRAVPQAENERIAGTKYEGIDLHELTIGMKELERIIEWQPPYDNYMYDAEGPDPSIDHPSKDMCITCGKYGKRRWYTDKKFICARSDTIAHEFGVNSLKPNAHVMLNFPDEEPDVLSACLSYMLTNHYDNPQVPTGSHDREAVRQNTILAIKLVAAADRFMIRGLKKIALLRIQHVLFHQWSPSDWVAIADQAFSQKFFRDLRLQQVLCAIRDARYDELVEVWGKEHRRVAGLPFPMGDFMMVGAHESVQFRRISQIICPYGDRVRARA